MAAFQASWTSSPLTVAVRVAGALGGWPVGRDDRRRHVGLDLCRGERAVVDAQLVDQAAEVLAPDGVAADPDGAGADLDRAGAGLARDLVPFTYSRSVAPSYVAARCDQPKGSAVGPRVSAGVEVRDLGRWPAGVRARVERVGEPARALLQQHRAPVRPLRVTHASSVIPVVRSSELESATLTMSLTPSKDSARPNFPEADETAPLIAPALPLPELSAADAPPVSSNAYAATRPGAPAGAADGAAIVTAPSASSSNAEPTSPRLDLTSSTLCLCRTSSNWPGGQFSAGLRVRGLERAVGGREHRVLDALDRLHRVGDRTAAARDRAQRSGRTLQRQASSGARWRRRRR